MSQLRALLTAHHDWIAPRSDQHTVIGVPHSREHRKTFVEPGGSFSPGVASFGVSLWLYEQEAALLYAPELLASDDLSWHWENGHLPILNSRWSAGAVEVQQQLFASALSRLENIVNTLHVRLRNQGQDSVRQTLYLVLRPYGPAGGPIWSLAATSNISVEVNGKTVLLAAEEAETFGAVSYEQDQTDISAVLKQGKLPAARSVRDRDGLCGGALAYPLQLVPGEEKTLNFDFFVHPLEHTYKEAFVAYHRKTYGEKYGEARRFWEKLLYTTQLSVPDTRFVDAYYSTLAQMLLAMVDHEVRIATITYPLFWLRDGAYIIVALDKAGLHEVVRQQLERIKDRVFASGFGAEPDAFGEGIWVFATHFQLTQDRAWLRSVYPCLKARADWIIKARHTQEYLYADTEARVPANRLRPDTDLICEPARDGLIQGRMDWHRPLIWINAFAYLGLRHMAELASVLGYADDAALYAQEAKELHAALYLYAKAHFAENERDLVCALWPTEAFSPEDPLLKERFAHWWQRVRLHNEGQYTPEPLWKYFELGQAHNYLLLGERTKALQTVDYYLEHHDVRNLYGWLEDNHDIAELWSQIEGWYSRPSRQPHGWVSSELFLLLRDMLLYEEGQTLIIGQGIPPAWLQAGAAPIQCNNVPTNFGPLDLEIAVEASTEKKHVYVRFHSTQRLPAQIELRLPGQPARGISAEESYGASGVLAAHL